MERCALRVVPAFLVAMALTSAGVMAGEGPAPEVSEPAAPAHRTPRCTAYFSNYHQDASLLADLELPTASWTPRTAFTASVTRFTATSFFIPSTRKALVFTAAMTALEAGKVPVPRPSQPGGLNAR